MTSCSIFQSLMKYANKLSMKRPMHQKNSTTMPANTRLDGPTNSTPKIQNTDLYKKYWIRTFGIFILCLLSYPGGHVIIFYYIPSKKTLILPISLHKIMFHPIATSVSPSYILHTCCNTFATVLYIYLDRI